MSGFGNPFKEIPRAIWKSIKRKVIGMGHCTFCGWEKEVADLEGGYRGRYICKDK